MSDSNRGDFKQKVYTLVAQIPSGRVMCYSQVAALAGSPNAARIVGQVAHFGPSILHLDKDCESKKFETNKHGECNLCHGQEIPWHRLVRKNGGMAGGFPGGMNTQQLALENEGIKVRKFRVDIDKLLYWPNE